MPGTIGLQVPQEAVYHTELYRILRAWLPDDVSISSEVNVKESGRDRCDLGVQVTKTYKILLEIVANEPIEGVKKKFEQMKKYVELVHPQEAWVIHFTIKQENDTFQYPWFEDSGSQIPIKVMHIWHSRMFDKVKICLREQVLELELKHRI